jgi:hypothetical protein
MDQSDKFWGLAARRTHIRTTTLTHFWREKPTKEQLMEMEHKFTSRRSGQAPRRREFVNCSSGWYYERWKNWSLKHEVCDYAGHRTITSRRRLDEAVQGGLDKGWRCQGGVAIVDMGDVVNGKRLGYVQAMVKED